MSAHLVLGNRLKKMREIKGVNQEDIAALLNVKRQTYSAYERGVSIPDSLTLAVLAKYFECSADYLIGTIDNPSPWDSSVSVESNDSNTDDFDENDISLDDIRFAFRRGKGDLTEEEEQELLRIARIAIKMGKRKK